MSEHNEWIERIRRQHQASVERGEHDGECEYDVDEGFMLCNCSKRRREAAGFTEPPTEPLWFPPPDCTHCGKKLSHDGDCWCCHECSLTWSGHGQDGAEFTDDYGDLSRCEAHGRRKCRRCELDAAAKKEPTHA